MITLVDDQTSTLSQIEEMNELKAIKYRKKLRSIEIWSKELKNILETNSIYSEKKLNRKFKLFEIKRKILNIRISLGFLSSVFWNHIKRNLLTLKNHLKEKHLLLKNKIETFKINQKLKNLLKIITNPFALYFYIILSSTVICSVFVSTLKYGFFLLIIPFLIMLSVPIFYGIKLIIVLEKRADVTLSKGEY